MINIKNFNLSIIFILIGTFSIITAQTPVKVFILIGQSNMVGHGRIAGETTMGSLEYIKANDTGPYNHLTESNGSWATRSDVWYYHRRGDLGNFTVVNENLRVGLGSNDGTIGPELQFGHVIGDHFDEQVLIIKTAWGGKSLGEDFLPPSASGATGPYYTAVLDIVNTVVADIGSFFPAYNNQGYEIVGIGWHQGWNDAGNDAFIAAYTDNMIAYIKDIRTDLRLDNLPFVIASSGHGGYEDPPYGGSWMIKLQTIVGPNQLKAAEEPEFAGNVAAIDTRPFWRNDTISPSQAVYHWNLNSESYLLIGNSIAEEMIKLLPAAGISGCMDTLYQEYNPNATIDDPNACINLIAVSIQPNKQEVVKTLSGFRVNIVDEGVHSISFHSLSGEKIHSVFGNKPKSYNFQLTIPTGMYIIKISTSNKLSHHKVAVTQ